MTASATPQFAAPVFSGPRILAAIIDLDGTMTSQQV
jgi:phosphoglycolate phosphatase